jgi:ADP-ribose pyrophosphatase YjhB (NUDIX family)
VSSLRKTIQFNDKSRVFNVRTAAIIMRDDHVLVCREDDDIFAMLPGGRIELGEASGGALAREIQEELQCEGAVGQLLFTVENLFHLEGEEFHQIGLYYAATLPDSFPFTTDGTCLVTHDEGHELKFNWVPATFEGLTQWALIPVWLRERMGCLPTHATHLIIDER